MDLLFDLVEAALDAVSDWAGRRRRKGGKP
jgi:hypothetical protein